MNRLEQVGALSLLTTALEYLEPIATIANGFPCSGCQAAYQFGATEQKHREGCRLERLIEDIKGALGVSS